jgi:cupin fold WbuC family metalloprotein
MDNQLIPNEEKSLWEVGEDCLDRAEEALDAAQATMKELEGQEFTRDTLEAYLVLAERLGNNISKALEEADKANRICKELISGERPPRQKARFDMMLSRIGFIVKDVEAVSHRDKVYKSQLIPKVLKPEEMKGFEKLVSKARGKVIDQQLLDDLAAQAKASPRLRMNLNFHQSLDEKCHRFLNALEPGTVVAVHHHPTKDETIVILRGRVAVTTYDDSGVEVERVELCHEGGRFGINIPKNVWHTVECLESAVLFECKEGPFVPHEQEGILEIAGQARDEGERK